MSATPKSYLVTQLVIGFLTLVLTPIFTYYAVSLESSHSQENWNRQQDVLNEQRLFEKKLQLQRDTSEQYFKLLVLRRQLESLYFLEQIITNRDNSTAFEQAVLIESIKKYEDLSCEFESVRAKLLSLLQEDFFYFLHGARTVQAMSEIDKLSPRRPLTKHLQLEIKRLAKGPPYFDMQRITEKLYEDYDSDKDPYRPKIADEVILSFLKDISSDLLKNQQYELEELKRR